MRPSLPISSPPKGWGLGMVRVRVRVGLGFLGLGRRVRYILTKKCFASIFARWCCNHRHPLYESSSSSALV